MPACGEARLGKRLAVLAAALCFSVAGSAFATTFVFDQTGSTVPGFVVAASLSINGPFADLPMISSSTNPGLYDFSPLSAFNITLPGPVGENHYTLADFTAPTHLLTYPDWSISPAGIDFINVTDTTDFLIGGFGVASTIGFDSDGPTTPTDCMTTGRCISTGNWDPVAAPEPASAVLLLAGLLGAALPLRKRMRAARPLGN